MANFIVIFFSFGAGLLLRHSRTRFPAQSARALNAFVIHLSYPALILAQFPLLLKNTPIDTKLLLPVSMAWIQFALSWITFSFLGKKFGWSRATIGALILTAGLGNTSFVGFPLLEALLGLEAVGVGIIVDQPGSFLVLSTIGIITAAAFAGASLDPRSIAKRVFTFPPFLALLLSIVWWATGLVGYDQLKTPFERISTTLVPLALFAVGLQMGFNAEVLRAKGRKLFAGLSFKLVAVPVFFFGFYMFLLGQRDFVAHVTVLESAMAPMIT
ncbi:MAG TPA: AEC family transporter, partial [Bdellovibrionales bacterium]|nr:AEC family transporter [Bdellovibrionales bacterium]